METGSLLDIIKINNTRFNIISMLGVKYND